jgi:hypothetical protein
MSQSNQYFIYCARMIKIKAKPMGYSQWLALAAKLAQQLQAKAE